MESVNMRTSLKDLFIHMFNKNLLNIYSVPDYKIDTCILGLE